MADDPIYLVEVDAYTGSGVETLRFGTHGYTTKPTDTPANTLYRAAIRDPGTFGQSMFGGKKTMGTGERNVGEIVLVNASGGLDALLGYGFDGRAVKIKRLANLSSALSTATTIFRGTVERIDSTGDAFTELRLRLFDRRLELEEPVQTNTYAGTVESGGDAGNLDNGTPDMKDKPKPLVFGSVRNIAPICVNPFDLIYQVHDGEVTSITVCDGQVPLATVGNYATVALLQAAHVPPGKIGTCIAEGKFMLGVETMFQLTADVVEGASASDRYAGALVQRVLTKMGVTGVNTAGFDALDAAAPYELGIYLEGGEKGEDVIGKLMASVGAALLYRPNGNIYASLPFDLGTPSWTIDENTFGDDGSFSILANPDTGHGLPAYRVILTYGVSYVVQDDNAVCPGCGKDRRSYASKPVRRVRDGDSSVRTKFLLAPELVIETLIVSRDDAETEVGRRGDLYHAERQVIEVPVPLSRADDIVLGSTGTVPLDRFGWGAGKDFVVIDREDRLADGWAVLTLWG